MKREFLEGLGLSSELIDQIMAEHGKTVTSLENKLTAKDEELQTSKTTIGELTEKVKKFDGVDLEGLKNGVKEWEKKYQTDLMRYVLIILLSCPSSRRLMMLILLLVW